MIKLNISITLSSFVTLAMMHQLVEML